MPTSPSEPPSPPDEAESIIDDLAADLEGAIPADMLEEASEFIKDALAAHPVVRLLAERVQKRAAKERSGDEIARDVVLPPGEKGKASGEDR